VSITLYYIKYLQNLVDKLIGEYRLKSILLIATTSEGESLEHVMRHTYASPLLLWNLDYSEFKEFVYELNPPRESVDDELWRLTGGNPRALIEIVDVFNWNTSLWVKSIEAKLKAITETVGKSKLRRVLENIDALLHGYEVRKKLIEYNLIVYVAYPTLAFKKLNVDQELGIGEYYAWQIPAYKRILLKIIQD